MNTPDYKAMLERASDDKQSPAQEAQPIRAAGQALLDRSYDYKFDKKEEFKEAPSAKSVLHRFLSMLALVVALCLASKFLF